MAPELAILAYAAKDVFHVDDGIVDQLANGDRQAPSVMVLIDRPKARNAMTVTMSDSGMAVSVMNVVRKLKRKKNKTTTTRRAPSRNASRRS